MKIRQVLSLAIIITILRITSKKSQLACVNVTYNVDKLVQDIHAYVTDAKKTMPVLIKKFLVHANLS